MARLVTISRAAKLVGVSRGKLQRHIRDGDIESFEGMIRLDDLATIFPQAKLEDNTIQERLNRIIEHAAHRARNRTTKIPPDMETLAARVNILTEELVEAKLEISIFHTIFDKLKSRLRNISNDQPDAGKLAYELEEWLLAELEKVAEKKFQQFPLLATDNILRIVAAQVHIEPSGHEFFVEGSNTILESALASGLALNYGCSNGNCGKCRSRLIAGNIKKVRTHDFVLTEKEKLQGYFLACSNTAVTDIVIEAEEAHNESDIPAQTISAWVRKHSEGNEHVRILNLKTPRTQRLRFLAGQSVKLEIPGIASSTLHIASCPCDDMNLQFHIATDRDDPFTEYILNQVRTNEVIHIEGPQGHFVLREDEASPMVFIAFGAGFAPIKSLIEHAMTLDVTEHIHLYWIVPAEEQLYLHNLCRSWDDAFERFSYIPVIASENIIETIAEDIDDLQVHHFYIAGPEDRVEESKNALQAQGVNSESIFSESIE